MHTVRIEFRRIQSFLFQVPRLRDMVGANVLVGEALRVGLCELVLHVNGDKLADYPPLSGLDEIPKQCRPPSSHDADPLNDADSNNRDDPWRQYRLGVLSRDAGHFIAAFPDEETAECFGDQAKDLLTREVPGLRFDIRVEPAGSRVNTLAKGRNSRRLVDLPQFQVCEESGRGAATKLWEIGRPPASDQTWISHPVETRKEAGARFYSRTEKTKDVIGLLQDRLAKYGQTPQDFNALCAGGYLAVIHADGNDVGRAYKNRMSNFSEPEGLAPEFVWLAKEAHGERFYRDARVGTRRALIEALDQTFQPDPESNVRPFQLLMLGGDDLSMVCRADAALRFVINYAIALRDLLPQEATALTFGAGVVIARPNVPFHHLYDLVEALTRSAKRLYRGLPDAQKASVVDWMVSTTAWIDDPIAQRRRYSLIRAEVSGAVETLALTRRPCRVLKDGVGPDLGSLEDLSELAKQLSIAIAERRIARSQLRNLVDGLAKGRRLSAMLFDELPKDLQQELGQSGMTALWESIGDGSWLTSIADLVELVEIGHLGRTS